MNEQPEGIHLLPEAVARREHQEAVALAVRAGSLRITDDETYELAGAVLNDIKAKQKQLKEEKEKILAPMREAIDHVRRLFGPAEEELGSAETTAKGEIARYREEAERRAREEEARRRDEMRALAEQLAEEAAQLEAEGRTAAAKAVLEQAEDAEIAGYAAPPIQGAPALKGVAIRQSWKYAVEDFNKVPRQYLTVDHKKVGQVVRAMKENTDIPGIRVWADSTVAAGAKR